MNSITEEMLQTITDWDDLFKGAYSIREDGQCDSFKSSENIKIIPKTDKPGIDIYISKRAQNETVFIPACVTKGSVNDLVYNDFHVEAGAFVTIVAGCGVHTDTDEGVSHNGVHRFLLEENAHVIYKEKHIGSGIGTGSKNIDPVTDIHLAKGAILEMDTKQLKGVDKTLRKTNAILLEKAKLIIHESLLTDSDNVAETDFLVEMNGCDSSVDLISRSVAKGNSTQKYHSHILGNTRCYGHSECDAILVDNGKVNASPELYAGDIDASLIHEAAIGKIAGEQLIKLMTLGLTKEEAEAKIIEGFLLAN